jgi:hypothetical protein
LTGTQYEKLKQPERYESMSYYLMNAVPRWALEHEEVSDFATILALEGGTLPVFTSLDSFWDFGKVFYPEKHVLSPVPFEIGASDLADLADQMAKMSPVGLVVFDPVAICVGRCDYATEPNP